VDQPAAASVFVLRQQPIHLPLTDGQYDSRRGDRPSSQTEHVADRVRSSSPSLFLETEISNGRGPDTSDERLHICYTEVLLSVLDFSWGGNGSANYFINNGAR
jgi:hypothetical protein